MRSAFGKLFALSFVWNLRISFKLNRFELSFQPADLHDLPQPDSNLRSNPLKSLQSDERSEETGNPSFLRKEAGVDELPSLPSFSTPYNCR